MTAGQLAAWIARELEARDAILGIPRALFFRPQPDDPFAQRLHGVRVATPVGPAAGPHTQLARNLVVSWLCGARCLELKTVQTLDAIEVSKPCIDMQDAGYNVEWSQELSLDQAFAEYLLAWVLIHALHRRLGFAGEGPDTLFTLSVGYNREGLLKPNVQGFLRRMRDAGPALAVCVEEVARWLPEAREVEIPARLSHHATLSTMHGCPPDEIGWMARHLMEAWGLPTSVKLNPTLLGPERVRGLLQGLGWRDVTVPDAAFGHDLRYPDALALLRDLRAAASACGVALGVKLSNTLEVENRRAVFAPSEKMMYLSGRPLHALTVQLAHQLQQDHGGALSLSFSGGADAFNTPQLLACGIETVTTCSDLLRPGGHTRLPQYLAELRAAMANVQADSLPAFVCRTSAASGGPGEDERAAALHNLARYADEVARDPRYDGGHYARRKTKGARPLGLFDCIVAPCTDACGVRQQPPRYLRALADGRLGDAARAVRADNPLGAVLGRACHTPCQLTCLRTHYDEPIAIRPLKQFIMDREAPPVPTDALRGDQVAVVGLGACGASAAWFLAEAGYAVTVFDPACTPEAVAAGSVAGFRAEAVAVAQDLRRLCVAGVVFRGGAEAACALAGLSAAGFRRVVVAAPLAWADFFGAEQPVLNAAGLLAVDEEAGRTSVTGVYAGGEAVRKGPPVLVRAAGEGRRIAEVMGRSDGRPAARGTEAVAGWADWAGLVTRRAVRVLQEPAWAEPGVPEEAAARREAARCLDCDRMCSTCVSVCPNLAIQTYVTPSFEARVPQLAWRGGRLAVEEGPVFRAAQRFQVFVLADCCNACGNCVTFCPAAGRPWRDKPRVYFDAAAFEVEPDNAFRWAVVDGRRALLARWGGRTHTLALGTEWRYRAEGWDVELDTATFRVVRAVPPADAPEGAGLDLAPCAAMAALWRGLAEGASYLPT